MNYFLTIGENTEEDSLGAWSRKILKNNVFPLENN